MHEDGEENKRDVYNHKNYLHLCNYEGSVIWEHLKINCVTRSFRGTQFLNPLF